MTYEKAKDNVIYSHFDYETRDKIYEALEKQIPKKTFQKYEHINEYLYCPICDEYIANRYAEYKPPFCQHCGQALKWR